MNSEIPIVDNSGADEEVGGESDRFLDADDDFPFHDCVSTQKWDQSTSDLPAATLRRRSSSRRGSSSEDSTVTTHRDRPEESPRYRKSKFRLDSKGKRGNLEISESSRTLPDPYPAVEESESTITNRENDYPVRQISESVDSAVELNEPTSSSNGWLVIVAGWVIKAVSFQFSLLFSFISLPVSALYYFYLLIVDPFRVTRCIRGCMRRKLIRLWNVIWRSVSPLIGEWLKEHKSICKLVFQFGWGFFWAAYVGCVLCGLFVSSLVISGFFMKLLVEEPLQMKRTLNFDYTNNSPVAFAPITTCAAAGCGVNCMENNEVAKLDSQLIPRDHRLQITVSLTLPESDYNRNLGIFQVRVDFTSATGEILASSRRPCMLKFKSEPIRLLLTFLKVVPLVAGYVVESETINLKFRGFKEGKVPTACIRVLIEHRAEYKPGAGIPEIYDGSILLESELPFFARIIWSWRKTIFIWVSIMSFILGLLFMLICCRPMVLPRSRQRNSSARRNAQGGAVIR